MKFLDVLNIEHTMYNAIRSVTIADRRTNRPRLQQPVVCKIA